MEQRTDEIRVSKLNHLNSISSGQVKNIQWKTALQQDPFPTDGYDGHFFSGGRRSQLLHFLQRWDAKQPHCFLIYGEPGVGKTVLLQRLIKKQDPAQPITLLAGEQLMRKPSMALALIHAFAGPQGVQRNSQPSLRTRRTDASQAVQDLLTYLRQMPRILYVDNAELLRPQQLRELLDLVAKASGQFRLVLWAIPVLAHLLLEGELADQFKHVGRGLMVEPFDANDTCRYLEFRCTAARRSDIQLTQKVMLDIYRQSRGIPAQIHDAAHLWLNDRASLEVSMKQRIAHYLPLPLGHLMGLLILGGGLLWATLYAQNESRPQLLAHPVTPQPAVEALDIAAQPPTLLAVSKTTEKQWAEKLASAQSTAQPVLSPLPEVTTPPVISESIISTAEKNKPVPLEKSMVIVAPAKITKLSTPVVADALIDTKNSMNKPPVKKITTRVEENKLVETPAAPKEYYTIQLLSGPNRSVLQRLMDEHPELILKQTTKDGQDWYILSYGHFSSKTAAESAVAQLPISLGNMQPWVRRIPQ